MNNKGSLHIITMESSNINNFDVEFNSDTLWEDSHLNYFINFIFTDRRLCQLFEKYARKDYKRMSELEFIYPLVNYGFIIIMGISDNLLIYLPKELDFKQYERLNEILNKYNVDNMAIHLSKLNEKGELESENNSMTVLETIEYINNILKIDSVRKIKKI